MAKIKKKKKNLLANFSKKVLYNYLNYCFTEAILKNKNNFIYEFKVNGKINYV